MGVGGCGVGRGRKEPQGRVDGYCPEPGIAESFVSPLRLKEVVPALLRVSDLFRESHKGAACFSQ